MSEPRSLLEVSPCHSSLSEAGEGTWCILGRGVCGVAWSVGVRLWVSGFGIEGLGGGIQGCMAEGRGAGESWVWGTVSMLRGRQAEVLISQADQVPCEGKLVETEVTRRCT